VRALQQAKPYPLGAAIAIVLSGKRKSRRDFDIEYRLLLDSGVCWIGTRGHATFDHHNRAVRLLGVSIDITARKLAELQLQQ
jgi:PAS domain-containing protein